MKIHYYYRLGTHQEKQMKYMVEGLKKHSLTPIPKQSFNSYDIPDLAIFWAHKRKDAIKVLRKHNVPYIIMERGYIGDRHQWTSFGYNGLNGRADFCNQSILDSNRWNKHFKQYISDDYTDTSNNEYALVIGQVVGDAALEHIDIFQWYRQRIRELNKLQIPVVFREHPLNKQKYNGFDLKYKLDRNQNLEDSLKKAKFVVTFSSNSGVVSVLNGIPTLTYDEGSMVYNITGHNINNIITPDRQQWANRIAYCQWNPEEIKSGETWEHLKQKIEKDL